MNVLLINDSFPPQIDGVANAVCNYARILTQRGNLAVASAPADPRADDSVWPFPVVRYPSVETNKQIGYRAGLPFAPETFRNLEAYPLDLIHSHCPVTATYLARTLRARRRMPLILTHHSKFDVEIYNTLKGKLVQQEAIRLLADNVAACDEIWAVSRGAGENLKSMGVECDYIVMPNGVDLPVGRAPQEDIDRVTAGLDLPASVPLFLFVGRLRWYKGIRYILDALKILQEEGFDCRCVLVGDSSERTEITSYADSLGLTDRVFFPGVTQSREDVRAWYTRADLFLFPSTYDTNGLVVREAAACSLASVLIEGSCAAEGIADGQNGFLMKENAGSLASVLRALLRHPDTMLRVGENACREIYLSWEDAVRMAEERYGTVLERYKSGGFSERRAASDRLIGSMAAVIERYNKAVTSFMRSPRSFSELLDQADAYAGRSNDLITDILDHTEPPAE